MPPPAQAPRRRSPARSRCSSPGVRRPPRSPQARPSRQAMSSSRPTTSPSSPFVPVPSPSPTADRSASAPPSPSSTDTTRCTRSSATTSSLPRRASMGLPRRPWSPSPTTARPSTGRPSTRSPRPRRRVSSPTRTLPRPRTRRSSPSRRSLIRTARPPTRLPSRWIRTPSSSPSTCSTSSPPPTTTPRPSPAVSPAAIRRSPCPAASP